jgi:hypothetical protein
MSVNGNEHLKVVKPCRDGKSCHHTMPMFGLSAAGTFSGVNSFPAMMPRRPVAQHADGEPDQPERMSLVPGGNGLPAIRAVDGSGVHHVGFQVPETPPQP